jgi:hypothetical protein
VHYNEGAQLFKAEVLLAFAAYLSLHQTRTCHLNASRSAPPLAD